jgi:hypothetical protein
MKTLVVLEDESDVMDFLRRMLPQYSLIEATTAQQALRLFIDHGRQVDLLIATSRCQQARGYKWHYYFAQRFLTCL